MTAVPQPVALRSSHRLRPGQAGEPWEASLPRPSDEALEAARLHGQVQRLARHLPDGLRSAVAEVLEELWCVDPAPAVGLLLRSPDEEEQTLQLNGERIRLGSNAACHLQLPDESVAEEHCELQQEGEGWWLVDLGSGQPTVLGGYVLEANERRPLAPEDEIQIGEHRLGVQSLCPAPERRPVKLRFQDARTVREQPFSILATADDLWLQVRAGAWHGYLLLPQSWLSYAYSTLGCDDFAPQQDEQLEDNALDLAVTTAVLERVARRLAERTQAQIEVGPPIAGFRLPQDPTEGEDGWLALRFDLDLAGDSAETFALWPVCPLGGGCVQQLATSRWGRGLRFPVRILAGGLALEPEPFNSLGAGDTLIPDRWLPEPAPEGTLIGEALLTLQGFVRGIQLHGDADRTMARLEGSPWELQPEGGLFTMQSQKSYDDATAEARSVPPLDNEAALAQEQESTEIPSMAQPDLPGDLELMLTFELDRLNVSLEELAQWETGASIALDRRPGESIRILLHHAGGSRVVGEGRVVILDGHLGIRIEDWRPGIAG